MPALIPFLAHHDERALHALVRRRRRALDRAMHGITHLGDTAAIVVITIALLLAPVAGARALGAEAAVALALSHLLVQALKRSIARPRPRLPVGCDFLVRPPDRFSFPSGHATAALCFALVMAPTLPAVPALLVVGVALLVGVSRCYLGVHYPGDVLMGWLLAALGIAVARLLALPLG